MSHHHRKGRIPKLTEAEWARVVGSLELTPRETDVLRGLLRGGSDKQIGREIGMKLPTVRAHLRHMFTRIGHSDRLELVLHVFAIVRGG